MKRQMTAFVMVLGALALSCNNPDEKTAEKKDTLLVAPTTVEKTTTIKTVEVTPKIKTSFTEKYPKAADVQWTSYEDMQPLRYDIDWELAGWPQPDTSYYTAYYIIDTIPYWSWYNKEGDWVATVTPVNTSGLPDAVNNVLQSQFAGYTIVSATKENDKNRAAYEIKMEKGEDKMKLLIDEKGNIMKKKGKENGQKIKEKNV